MNKKPVSETAIKICGKIRAVSSSPFPCFQFPDPLYHTIKNKSREKLYFFPGPVTPPPPSLSGTQPPRGGLPPGNREIRPRSRDPLQPPIQSTPKPPIAQPRPHLPPNPAIPVPFTTLTTVGQVRKNESDAGVWEGLP